MFNLKVLFIVGCLVVVASAAVPYYGGIQELQGAEREKAIQLLETSLKNLKSGEGSYRLSSLDSVTGQVVEGELNTYEGEFIINGVTKPCVISIWSRIWLHRNKITLSCEGDAVVTQTQIT